MKGGRDGWLNTKKEPSGLTVALCEHTKVTLESSKNGRDYFSPEEGAERGGKFSVISGNLVSQNPGYGPAVNLRFNIAEETLVFPGGSVKAITHPMNPIGLGFIRFSSLIFPTRLVRHI